MTAFAVLMLMAIVVYGLTCLIVYACLVAAKRADETMERIFDSDEHQN